MHSNGLYLSLMRKPSKHSRWASLMYRISGHTTLGLGRSTAAVLTSLRRISNHDLECIKWCQVPQPGALCFDCGTILRGRLLDLQVGLSTAGSCAENPTLALSLACGHCSGQRRMRQMSVQDWPRDYRLRLDSSSTQAGSSSHPMWISGWRLSVGNPQPFHQPSGWQGVLSLAGKVGRRRLPS